MDPYVIVIMVMVGLFAWSSVTHRLKFRFKRLLMVIFFIFMAFVVAGAFIDFSEIFGGNNFFALSGAAIVNDIKQVFGVEPIIKRETLDQITEGVSVRAKDTTKGIISLPSTGSAHKNFN